MSDNLESIKEENERLEKLVEFQTNVINFYKEDNRKLEDDNVYLSSLAMQRSNPNDIDSNSITMLQYYKVGVVDAVSDILKQLNG